MGDEFGASPLGLSKRNARGENTTSYQGKNLDEDLENARARPGDQRADERLDMDDVLYGDLLGQEGSTPAIQSSSAGTLLNLKLSKLQSEMAAKESVLEASEIMLRDLRQEVASLQERNANLEQNISSLFNTAKMEIERKDAEIMRGRKEISRLREGTSRGQQWSHSRGHR